MLFQVFILLNLKSSLIHVSKKINSREKFILVIDNNVLDSFEKQLKRVLSRIMTDDFTPCLDSNCSYCNKLFSTSVKIKSD